MSARLSRRGAMAAAMALPAAPALAGPAADAELLALCGKAQTTLAAWMATYKRQKGATRAEVRELEAAGNDLCGAFWDVAQDVADVQASTLAGMAAKARLFGDYNAQVMQPRDRPLTLEDRFESGLSQQLALSVLHDAVRLGGPGA